MSQVPLAEQLRPQNLKDYIGQEKVVGSKGVIKTLISNHNKKNFLPSLIFWGPPGSGKTTLARIIAQETNRPFHEFSAVNTSVKVIEKEIDNYASKNTKKLTLIEDPNKKKRKTKEAPIVFIDEIHRFNKAQQDALLPHVEKGVIILIGATTENPSFEVIGPLLSRCRVVILKEHNEEDLEKIISNAETKLKVTLSDKAKIFLVQSSNGDARVALNVLEIASNLSKTSKISEKVMQQALQREQLMFDLKGEEYYNTISALHKSLRGSDPNAALYYLARMLEAGQDPLYIARRLVRFSSEDIGMANSNALVLATSTFMACERVGMPECNVILAHLVVYLAKCSKSNSLYIAYGKAADDVRKHGNLPIPLHIRNAPTKLMKDIGYGKGYDYSHSPKGKKKKNINYFPDKLKNTQYLK